MKPGDMFALSTVKATLRQGKDWHDIPGSEMQKGDMCLLLEIGDYDGPLFGFEFKVINSNGKMGWINSSSLIKVN